MNGSIDLSSDTALTPLADVVRDVLQATTRCGAAVFLAGAFARDLWLQFAHRIDTGRATADIDFAVQCEDWEKYEQIAALLLDLGFRRPEERKPHRFFHANGTPIDIVPFGDVERRDRTIAWPPDGSHVMNLVGFREALGSTVTFLLPGSVAVRVASLASLAALKLIAWQERGVREPGRDARDLHIILRHYVDADNESRLFDEIPGLADRQEYDAELAGAELLGRDLTKSFSAELGEELVRILEREASPTGEQRLAGEMHRRDTERARQLLESLFAGLRVAGDSAG